MYNYLIQRAQISDLLVRVDNLENRYIEMNLKSTNEEYEILNT